MQLPAKAISFKSRGTAGRTKGTICQILWIILSDLNHSTVVCKPLLFLFLWGFFLFYSKYRQCNSLTFQNKNKIIMTYRNLQQIYSNLYQTEGKYYWKCWLLESPLHTGSRSASCHAHFLEVEEANAGGLLVL